LYTGIWIAQLNLMAWTAMTIKLHVARNHLCRNTWHHTTCRR
jgi:hypothetical protein